MEIKDMQGKTARDLLELDGNVAVVTGGGRGLGRSMCKALGEFGAKVVGASRTEEELRGTVEAVEEWGGVADYKVTDVTDVESVRELVDFTLDRFGGIDILINNAATTLLKDAETYTDEEWQNILDVNLTGAFYCVREFGPHMIEQESGKIINVSSVGGLRGGAGVYLPYTASKGGLVSMTKGLASEWAPHNINVNTIVPGAFYTEMSAPGHDDPETHRKYLKQIPLHRIGDPDEIGPLAVYLASEAADFVTGEMFVIDGGMLMK